MKKIFAFCAAALMAASMYAGNYGILVNGNTYFAGEPAGEFEGFTQYLAHVPVKSGDFCQLCDADNRAVWAVPLNAASEQGFTYDENGKKYTISTDGCFDFYIKLKYEQDELYIGPGSNCGEGIDISGGGQGGGDGENIDFYAIGWINGADAGEKAYDQYDDKYKFVNGKLTIDCKMGSYIALKDEQGNFYYAEGTQDAQGDKVTFKWANGWSPCQKWALPEGTRYIIMRSVQFKGEIQLESVDKATYDAYQAIEQTPVRTSAKKVFVDGQLRIVRGEKTFDATGRQL